MYLFNFHHTEPSPKHFYRRHITIPPSGLRRFIRILRRLGLEPVSLKQVVQSGGPEAMAPHHVLITFDDGYENFYQYAMPVLMEENCPATVFVLAGKFSGYNDWEGIPQDEQDRLLSQEQVAEIARSGMVTIGSHGLYHQVYPDLSPEALRDELHDSYGILQEIAGDAFVPALAYPYGYYNDTVIEMTRKSPYRFAFTTDKGRWLTSENPYTIPRYSIYYRDANGTILFLKLLRNGILFPQLNPWSR